MGMLALALPELAGAQAVGGAQISGFVRDSSSGSAGVDVTVTQTDTGISRSGHCTGGDSAFAFPNLPVGPYPLEGQPAGFQHLRAGRHRPAGQLERPVVNIGLQIGAIGEQLTVTANASMVETRSTSISRVIDSKRVVELPLSGRQATELIFLSGLRDLGASRRPQHQQGTSRR